MCGIAGIFSTGTLDPDQLFSMSKSIRHRGPDGEGFVLFSNQNAVSVASSETPKNAVNRDFEWSPSHHSTENMSHIYGGFAHRRLAILDLEATGHQPMCCSERRYWITYNGEIYNYRELRNELELKGHRFKSSADTEVILYAFIEWGNACLNRFNGMWAFAIYDTHKQILFAARDRFGVKPFYYSFVNNTFLFASEQKALAASTLIKTSVNPEAVFDYFVFGQLEYEAEGLFKSIIELLPATCLTYDFKRSELNTHTYYSLPINHQTGNWDARLFKEKAEEIKSLLLSSIKLRLNADVEVGSCLSGGIDSSVIVGMMRNLRPDPEQISVFTASFPGTQADETKWAKQMAEFARVEQHFCTPTVEELIRDFESLTKCQDIPIWSTSTYAQYRVMQLVKETGLKVVLDGQGGDEVFAGYSPHFSFFWKGLHGSERLSEFDAFGGITTALKHHIKQQLRFDYIFRLPAKISSSVYKNYFPDIAFLNPDFYNEYTSRFHRQAEQSQSNLNDRLGYEMQNTSLKGYLKCEDRCSMWHGIESRTPFSDDHTLIEAVFSLPSSMKIHKGTSKILLREAAHTFIPAEIANRKDKMGYATPNNSWMNQAAPAFKDLFTPDLAPFLNLKKLSQNYDRFFQQKQNIDTGRIFKFISFASWMKVFFRN
jgi:asparagine synthase (glutamine-hydrolysing)